MNKRTLLIAPIFFLAGCSSNFGSDSEEAPSNNAVNLTPFSTFSDHWALPKSQGGLFNDNYTRLVIRELSPQEGQAAPKARQYKSRDWLSRFLVGKSATNNLTVTVNAGLFQETVPIVTLGHKSSAAVGEQWEAHVDHKISGFPLFLVRPGLGSDTPKISILAKSTIEFSSAATARGVDAALTIANALAPGSQVATTLSAPSIKAKADAVDTALSNLFQQSVTEDNKTQPVLRDWSYESGIDVTYSIPENEDQIDSNRMMTVGTWRISFEEPSVSIFVDWRICAPGSHGGWTTKPQDTNYNIRCATDRETALTAVYHDVDADEVLGKQLLRTSTQGSIADKLGNVSGYISQLAWYKRALGDLSTDKRESAASEFCRHVKNEMSNLGLSKTDAGIVVWAIPQTPDFPADGRTAIAGDTICKESIEPIMAARTAK